MAAPREELFVSLFTLLEGLGTPGDQIFKFTSRVFQSWDDTAPSQSPAMFMVKGPEEALPVGLGLPPLWRITARVVMYIGNDEGRLVPPSTKINQILSSLEGSLERKPIEPPPPIPSSFLRNPAGSFGTTLGGLCYSCQIAGQIEIFEGVIGSDAVAIVSIDMLTSA